MTSKTLFNKQKELRDQLNAVVKSTWFKNCLIYVRGELMEQSSLTPAAIEGAKHFERILLEFTDEEPELTEFPKPELQHDLTPRKPSDKPK